MSAGGSRPDAASGTPLLEIRDLSVRFPGAQGPIEAVRSASLQVLPGEVVALVGESGSGKSTTGLAVPGLLAPQARQYGEIYFRGRELAALTRRERRAARGRDVGMVFQDPGTSLNPVLPVGRQVAEAARRHDGLSWRAATARARELLERVGIHGPASRMDDPPSRFSGGQRQRILIAAALAGRPSLLIADEPTSALDVTTQARVVDLLLSLRDETGMGILWISHDLSLMARAADRIVVMAEGDTVESAHPLALLAEPTHPASRALVQAIPAAPPPPPQPSDPAPARGGDVQDDRVVPPPLIVVHSVSRSYAVRSAFRRGDPSTPPAVDGVSMEIRPGEALGLLGESGAGKTTLGRIVSGLTLPSAGEVTWVAADVDGRPPIQMVFQNPTASLNPRFTVEQLVAEPLIHGSRRSPSAADLRGCVVELLERVHLSASMATRYPWQLSGGERQRVAIARALAPDPRLIVLDEPVSALDLTVRRRILDLLAELRTQLTLTYLVISHDFATLAHLCDRVAVMNDGRIVEVGAPAILFHSAESRVTRDLVAASGLLPRG